MENSFSPCLLALVGMPGSGKSETASYLKDLGFSLVRFGQITDRGLSEKGLPITPENEKNYREEIRKLYGMEAYAVLTHDEIKNLMANKRKTVIDGLYSWEEYKYLISKFPNLKLIHVYAEPEIRYGRLSTREVRPFSKDEARTRDISEIENLQKGGPIAIADYLLDNNSNVDMLHAGIEKLLKKIEND